MSESIHAGYLPLWNPYINFGIPAYGDMSGGYWSPVTWLIASTVGYNAYTLTIELLLYVLIGGLGVYKLTGSWTQDHRVRTIAGLAYMCCGYNIGHLQHFNWISGAAFLPWCFFAYAALLAKLSLKNVVSAAVLFYMLVSSAHPGITIGSIYFFIAYLLYHAIGELKHNPGFETWRKLLISNISLLILLSILSAGLIIGYLDIIPHFVRGEKISIAASLANPTTLQSWLSSLLPFATVKNEGLYQTDISMRNSYFGLCVLLFFLLAIFRKKTGFQKFLLVTGLFFALLSAGGFIKIVAYKYLPLIGFVRLNGEFRIFAILCFIILALIELDKFVRQKNSFRGSIRVIYYVLELILLIAIVIGAYNSFYLEESVLFKWQLVMAEKSLALRLKSLIDALSFYDLLWMQGIVQLLILWGIKWCLRAGNFNMLRNLVIADLVLASLMNIPFTGVGKASTGEVQNVLNHSPIGIPVPPDGSAYRPTTEEEALVGDWDWYSKQIAINSESAYPIALKNMRRYFESIDTSTTYNAKDKPWIFLSGAEPGTTIEQLFFSPNRLSVKLAQATNGKLVYKQNYYPHWVYYTGKDKKAKRTVVPYAINFMALPVKPGVQEVTISFEPTVVVWGMALSFISFLLSCVLLIILRTKQFSLS